MGEPGDLPEAALDCQAERMDAPPAEKGNAISQITQSSASGARGVDGLKNRGL